MIRSDEEAGWMNRCVLLGSIRQVEGWTSALRIAAAAGQAEVVFLEDRPSSRSDGDRNRIFVSSDHRNFVTTPECARVSILDGLERFSGLDLIPSDDARVHVIEITRHAVEAQEWAKGGVVVTSAAADAARNGSPLQFVGLEVAPPSLDPSGTGEGDIQAAQSLTYIGADVGSAPTRWGPRLFIYDRLPLVLSGDEALLDMTGPPRPLLRGPYLWAPKGRWRISAEISFDEDAASHEFQFRWGPPLTPTIHNVRPDKSGRYEVVLEADWPEIDGMEFTITVVHGCVGGEVGFGGAKVAFVDLR
ncbi:MAG: hypothetical protein ACK4MH_09630 [Brevundimonas sp.]|uniref:hypothetical protein n=1 Tax=Brevundimonas sp. TaxID=1871086 RepID=UPI00391AE99B